MSPEQATVRPTFDSYAIVELMGHARMIGRLTEVERFGAKLGKLDVIDAEGIKFTDGIETVHDHAAA
jgi:hypothetical protein